MFQYTPTSKRDCRLESELDKNKFKKRSFFVFREIKDTCVLNSELVNGTKIQWI